MSSTTPGSTSASLPVAGARRGWRGLLSAVAASLSILLAGSLSALIGPASPAAALEVDAGPGFSASGSNWSQHLGGWLDAEGRVFYCIDKDRENPRGDFDESVRLLPGQDEAVSGDVKWVIATFGQTTDNVQAAAVQWYVWHRLGQWESTTNPPDPATLRDPEVRQDVIERFTEILDAVQNRPTTAAIPAAPTVVLAEDGLRGTVTVPAGYNSLSLGGGVFTDSGLPVLIPAVDGGTYAISPAVPDGATSVTVSVTGFYTYSTTALDNQALVILERSRNDVQRLASASPTNGAGQAGTSATVELVPDTRATGRVELSKVVSGPTQLPPGAEFSFLVQWQVELVGPRGEIHMRDQSTTVELKPGETWGQDFPVGTEVTFSELLDSRTGDDLPAGWVWFGDPKFSAPGVTVEGDEITITVGESAQALSVIATNTAVVPTVPAIPGVPTVPERPTTVPETPVRTTVPPVRIELPTLPQEPVVPERATLPQTGSAATPVLVGVAGAVLLLGTLLIGFGVYRRRTTRGD